MGISSQTLKIVTIALCSVLIGYLAALFPAWQLPLLPTSRHWHPPVTPVQSTESPQIQGVSWVGTRTPYFDESVVFFRDVLKLPLKSLQPQFAEFELPQGDRLEVFGSRLPSNTDLRGPAVEFQVPDIERARTLLEASGVQFTGPIERDQASGAAWTHFWGPDGYLYGLNSIKESPSRPVASAGPLPVASAVAARFQTVHSISAAAWRHLG